MSGWSIIAAGLVCATGALIFLKVVANDIELANAILQNTEKRLEKASKRDAEEDEVEEEPIEVLAIGRGT